MMNSTLKQWNAGDEITAIRLEAMRKEIIRNRVYTGSGNGGLVASITDNGTMLYVDMPFNFVGVVQSGGISARSGTTPGKGNVELYLRDPSSGNLLDLGGTVTAYSILSTSGGIAANTYVILTLDQNNDYWITAMDCTS